MFRIARNRILLCAAAALVLRMSDGTGIAQELLPPPATAVPAAPSVVGTTVPPIPMPATGPAAFHGPASAPAGGVVGTLEYIGTKRHQCYERICQSPLGEMICNVRKPLSVLTGGMVSPVATPSAEQLCKPGPEGAAAQTKLAKLEAPKRLAAVEQLTDVDCRYFPEVSVALAAALRSDPCACVRLAAARVLTRNGCCDQVVRQALRCCAEGSSADGNPKELDQQIRHQAAIALAHCSDCSETLDQPLVPRPEYPDSQAAVGGEPTRDSSVGTFLQSASDLQPVAFRSAASDAPSPPLPRQPVANSPVANSPAAASLVSPAQSLGNEARPIGLWELWRNPAAARQRGPGGER